MQRSEREATEEAFRAAARALFISGETKIGRASCRERV